MELEWEVLLHSVYFLDLALDYHVCSKNQKLFFRGIQLLPEKWEKVMASENKYFD